MKGMKGWKQRRVINKKATYVKTFVEPYYTTDIELYYVPDRNVYIASGTDIHFYFCDKEMYLDIFNALEILNNKLVKNVKPDTKESHEGNTSKERWEPIFPTNIDIVTISYK